MTELTILPEPPREYPDPERGPSKVLFKHTEHDGIQGTCYDTGDAYWEQEASTLDDHMREIVGNDPHGWYVVEDFQMFYTRDYYGEVDGDAEYRELRPATWKDFQELAWVDGLAPWFVKLMAMTPLKMPARWPAP